jgi:hypothetical protein
MVKSRIVEIVAKLESCMAPTTGWRGGRHHVVKSGVARIQGDFGRPPWQKDGMQASAGGLSKNPLGL